MRTTVPPISEVRTALEGKTHAEVHELSKDCGVPFTTLWKIRDGTTANPGIETVRKFYGRLSPKRTKTVALSEQGA